MRWAWRVAASLFDDLDDVSGVCMCKLGCSLEALWRVATGLDDWDPASGYGLLAAALGATSPFSSAPRKKRKTKSKRLPDEHDRERELRQGGQSSEAGTGIENVQNSPRVKALENGGTKTATAGVAKVAVRRPW